MKFRYEDVTVKSVGEVLAALKSQYDPRKDIVFKKYIDDKLVDEGTIVEGWAIVNGRSATPDIHLNAFELDPPKKKFKEVTEFEVGVGLYKGEDIKGSFHQFQNPNPMEIKWTGKTKKYSVQVEVDIEAKWKYKDGSAGVDRSGG